MSKITRASIVFEINGHPHAMLMDGVNLQLLTAVIAAASPNGKLNVFRMGDEYRFETMNIPDVSGSAGAA